jgi:hypothetical protein
MSLSDFNLIFPLLKNIIFRRERIADLSAKNWTEICILASDLIIFHSGLDGSAAEIPRDEMLACIMEVLSNIPVLRNAGKDAMAALVMSAANAVEEITNDTKFSSQQDKKAMISITETLLDGLLTPQDAVRDASITALAYVTNFPSALLHDRDVKIWISLFDNDEISLEAKKIWEEVNGDSFISKDLVDNILSLVGKIR